MYRLKMSVHKLPTYERRRPEETLLYKVVADHLKTFITHLAEEDRRLPLHVYRPGLELPLRCFRRYAAHLPTT